MELNSNLMAWFMVSVFVGLGVAMALSEIVMTIIRALREDGSKPVKTETESDQP